jgi:hypothetical protein
MDKNLLIDRVNDSIEKGEALQSKLTPDILNIEGMSSSKVRCFLNNLVKENTRYFEIGCWKGSTLISALYGNEPAFSVATDNFTEWTGGHYGEPKKEFYTNCKKYLGYIPNFYECDCFSINLESINNINCYFYDGNHSADAHERAIIHFLPCLDNIFILIVDDWNFDWISNATRSGIKKADLKIHAEWVLPADYAGDRAKWWNGIGVYVLEKTDF